MLALACVTFLVVLPGCGRKPPKPPTLAELLTASDPVERRIAQADAARDGVKSLPALEEFSGTRDQALAQAIREVVALMLLKSVAYDQLSQYPGLSQLCLPEFDRAKECAALLSHATDYDSGEEGLSIDPSPATRQSSPQRQAIRNLLQMHGWAIPAALELSEQKEPASRLYGAEILRGLEAWGQSAAWDRLSKDPGMVMVSYGDHEITHRIGELVTEWLKNSTTYRLAKTHWTPEQDIALANSYVVWLVRFQEGTTDGSAGWKFLNELNKEAHVSEAQGWFEYWERARPVLQRRWAGP